MSESNKWEDKINSELKYISTLLDKKGFHLTENQPHISGERFLMTKEKLVLIGVDKNTGKKVIIKISNHEEGKKEITLEHKICSALNKIAFTNNRVLLPKEILFSREEEYSFWISEYIEQDRVFSTYSLEEQFFMIMRVFDMQESFYADTYENLKSISGIFSIYNANRYLEDFTDFLTVASEKTGKNFDLIKKLKDSYSLIESNKEIIDMYCGYLTHTDLAPGNTRINYGNIYLIDLSSMLFGNKYEGWARFLNWATIYSPNLEKNIIEYIKTNKDPDEYLSLRLMRIYKAAFLINYYIKSLDKTSGNLHLLTKKRLELWSTILNHLLDDKPVPIQIVYEHLDDCKRLRSPEEIERQKEFNLPTTVLI